MSILVENKFLCNDNGENYQVKNWKVYTSLKVGQNQFRFQTQMH